MRHNRLFAAGLAAALMLGAAAAPALAAPGKAKGKATAPGQTKTKPKPDKAKPLPKPKKAKKTKSGVSGGGVVNGAEFSIQARLRDVREGSASKGHFNYTDATTKVRCRGFNEFTPNLVDGTATVVFKNCTGVQGVTTIEVSVDDSGQPKDEVTPVVADHISFTAGALIVNGDLTDGNVKVR